MQLLRRPVAALTLAALGVLALAGPALADYPRPWQMGMQTPASPVAVQVEWLHDMVLFIITAICRFVC